MLFIHVNASENDRFEVACSEIGQKINWSDQQPNCQCCCLHCTSANTLKCMLLFADRTAWHKLSQYLHATVCMHNKSSL